MNEFKNLSLCEMYKELAKKNSRLDQLADEFLITSGEEDWRFRDGEMAHPSFDFVFWLVTDKIMKLEQELKGSQNKNKALHGTIKLLKAKNGTVYKELANLKQSINDASVFKCQCGQELIIELSNEKEKS